jgi:integrase
VSNGGKFKLYTVLNGLIFPMPTQPRISFERAILILGGTGDCQCDELTNVTVADVEDMWSAILVKVRDTQNCKLSFTILGEFYLEICRKHISVRKDKGINRFLVKYYNRKCAKMVMGKHKIGSAPREIASSLKVPNCNEYTGHCLRRTSATLLVDNGGDISALKVPSKKKKKNSDENPSIK